MQPSVAIMILSLRSAQSYHCSSSREFLRVRCGIEVLSPLKKQSQSEPPASLVRLAQVMQECSLPLISLLLFTLERITDSR